MCILECYVPKATYSPDSAAKIGKASYHKYKAILDQENAHMAVKLRGGRIKYTAENDAKFIRWLKDPMTSVKKKTTEAMMKEYDIISG